MRRTKRGFTLAELLIVVAIIGVLVAIAIPIFSSQLEKSREATDLANVRAAYSEVMNAAIVEDTSSPLYYHGTYQAVVQLKQMKNGWTLSDGKLVLGGISSSDKDHWKNEPKAKGRCKVYYSANDGVIINWCGEDHINKISANDFLIMGILKQILGSNYGYTVINSNEPYGQGGGTQKFIDYAREHGFDLADYGAATWQIYVKDGSGYLNEPSIYWSTLEITSDQVGNKIPVMGYRGGKYDVYYAEVVTYNAGTPNEYYSIKSNFANITNAGGSATFQFDSYEEAKAAYDKILGIYNEKGELTSSDISNNGLSN